MSPLINYNSNYVLNCWAGFLDLLGMKRLSKSEDYIPYFVALSQAIEQFRDSVTAWDNVGYAWFSDSFFVYTNDNSKESFIAIDSICKWFSYFLITGNVPVRGAISCGQLYSDRKNNLFFGKALTEAYEYGEAQDWIGLLLTPSATEHLEQLKLSAKNFSYAFTDIPYNKKLGTLIKNLPACIIGNWIGPNRCVDSLNNMLSQTTEDKIKKKYERTLIFMQDH
jgi:hypothetical protein